MFNQSPDDRLSSWSQFRQELEASDDPLMDVIEFWNEAPFIPYNKEIDTFNQFAWPTPWEIIVRNKYDDFTKSLMMAWTLKLTERYKDSKVEIKTYIDNTQTVQYNCIVIDEDQVLNYKDNEVVNYQNLPPSFRLENMLEVNRPR